MCSGLGLFWVFNVERMTVSPHDLTGELVEHQAGIGAAKAEAVGHDTIELDVANTLNGDWQSLPPRGRACRRLPKLR